MNACLFLLFLASIGTQAYIRLPELACPSDPDATVPCGEECSRDADCRRGAMCCTDSCAGKSCYNVTKSCTGVGGKTYAHRDTMNHTRAVDGEDTESCGMCWCFDGQLTCYRHECYVPGGPPLALP
ncbi:uncharacterized protein LOC101845278 [Aplysia californica]|uniref:Uncharacterized protein LOC101845278 n=1 Tax=Aplysia californica TaxID=6500 RepID=A0ABM0K6I3_APLCA|nr:uncharacterized protein LOC101845278 [Aplysia californica]